MWDGMIWHSAPWPANGEVYGLQSWYFAYVLATVLVLGIFVCVIMSKNINNQILLWLPLVIMLIVCTAVKVLSLKSEAISEYMAATAELRAYHVNPYKGSYEEKLEVLHHWLYRAGFKRWNKNIPIYLLSTEVLSVVAYFASYKLSNVNKTKIMGSSAVMFALMLVLCLFDRNFALSAKVTLRNPTGFPQWAFEEHMEQKIYQWDSLRALSVFGIPRIELSMERQLVYPHPSYDSTPAHYSNPKYSTESFLGIRTTNIRGWGYTKKGAGYAKSEGELPVKVFGFVPLEKVILTAGNIKEDGALVLWQDRP